MSIDFKRCSQAKGRIYMEAARLVCSEKGIRTAEDMLSSVLLESEYDNPPARGTLPSELVVEAFYRRLKIAFDSCGRHLGLHLTLEKTLQAANRCAESKPAMEPPPPPVVDPEALRAKELAQFRLLDCEEVAYILALSPRQVKKFAMRGGLKRVDLGHGKMRFRHVDVTRFIAKKAGDDLTRW